jgi:hypothetical protein
MAWLLALSRRGRVGVDLGCVASTSAYSQMDGGGVVCPSKIVPTSLTLLMRVSLAQFLVLSSLIFFIFHFLDFGHSHKIKYIFGKKIYWTMYLVMRPQTHHEKKH